jgi:hypothetical protein
MDNYRLIRKGLSRRYVDAAKDDQGGSLPFRWRFWRKVSANQDYFLLLFG